MGTGRRLVSCLFLLAAALCYATSSEHDGTVQRVLVIPVEFQDVTFSHERQELELYLSKVKEYFDDQFTDRDGLNFELAPTVTLPNDESTYGANGPDNEDINPEQMLADACEMLDESIDLSVFDNDGDGTVEHLVLLFAGRSESEGGHPDCLWSSCRKLSDKRRSYSRDGVAVDTFCYSPELGSNEGEGAPMAGIGIFCHELLHSFGIPDLYDTSAPGNQAYYSAALWGKTSIMDTGFRNEGGDRPPFLNAIEREMLGIGSARALEAGEIRLKPVQEGEWLRFETGNPGEYYLMEYRNGLGWDDSVGGHGLLIYHIDRSENLTAEISGRNVKAETRWKHNIVNGDSFHQCADLVEASGASDRIRRSCTIDENEIPTLFFPAGASSFGPFTEPAFRFWDGTHAGLSLNRIIECYPDEIVLLAGELSTQVSGIDLFQDAAIVEWNSVSEGPCDFFLDGELFKTGIRAFNGSHFSLLIEALEPASSHRFSIRDGSGYVCGGEFKTKDADPSGIVHINSEHFSRRNDGFLDIGSRIPLRIDNAANERVSWFADSYPIAPEADGRIALDRSFTLKAIIYREDGSCLIVIKEIKVK